MGGVGDFLAQALAIGLTNNFTPACSFGMCFDEGLDASVLATVHGSTLMVLFHWCSIECQLGDLNSRFQLSGLVRRW